MHDCHVAGYEVAALVEVAAVVEQLPGITPRTAAHQT